MDRLKEYERGIIPQYIVDNTGKEKDMVQEIKSKIVCKTDFIGAIDRADVDGYIHQIKDLHKANGFSNDPRITVTAYVCENELHIVYANFTDYFMDQMKLRNTEAMIV